MLSVHRVKIRNFRAIEYASVPFHPQLTVLIGENASGKTSVLDALVVALSPIVEGSIKTRGMSVRPEDFRSLPVGDLFGFEDRPSADMISISVETSQGNIDGEYSVEYTKSDRLSVSSSISGDIYPSLRHVYRDDSSEVAPVIAFYRETRAFMDRGRDREVVYGSYHRARSRRAALLGALSGRSVYLSLIHI